MGFASDLQLGRERVASMPYRSCVGIVLLNRFGLAWTGRRSPRWAARTDGPFWQLPQGGIERREDALAAARRELAEETGVTTASLIGEIPEWLVLELPPDLLGVALKGRYRGQLLKWYAMRLDGPDSEIDIRPRAGRKAEFDAWRWSRLDEVPAGVAPFRRGLYETVVERFRPLALAMA